MVRFRRREDAKKNNLRAFAESAEKKSVKIREIRV